MTDNPSQLNWYQAVAEVAKLRAELAQLREDGGDVEYGIEVTPAPPFGQPPRMEIITAETAAYYQQKAQDVMRRRVGPWQPVKETPDAH